MQENPTHFMELYPWSLRAIDDIQMYVPCGIHHLSSLWHKLTYQLHSSEKMKSWRYNRESQEEMIFPNSGGHAQSTSLDRGRRSSTHGYTVPQEGRKESTVKWGSDSLKTNPSTSYLALSLCIVCLLSFSLHMYQSRYIHILMRK